MTFRKELDLLDEKHKSLIRELEKTNQKKIYSQIDEEIKKKTKDPECWMKALSDSKGDEKKATAKYIDLRYETLWEDTVEKIIEPLRKKLENEYNTRKNKPNDESIIEAWESEEENRLKPYPKDVLDAYKRLKLRDKKK
jgi:hypothetical protein|tara:strand:+ start:135 stop:551 length:417 start_codon:yes stop_codon:yes gene_type:complete